MSKTSKNKQGELGKLVDVQQASPQTETTRAKQLEPFHWKPGQSGNPKGRPKGSRHKLAEDFVRALSEDFDENGVEAIKKVRAEDPSKYLTIIAQILPKDIDLNLKGDEAFVRMWELVAAGTFIDAVALSSDDSDGGAVN